MLYSREDGFSIYNKDSAHAITYSLVVMVKVVRLLVS